MRNGVKYKNSGREKRERKIFALNKKMMEGGIPAKIKKRNDRLSFNVGESCVEMGTELGEMEKFLCKIPQIVKMVIE